MINKVKTLNHKNEAIPPDTCQKKVDAGVSWVAYESGLLLSRSILACEYTALINVPYRPLAIAVETALVVRPAEIFTVILVLVGIPTRSSTLRRRIESTVRHARNQNQRTLAYDDYTRQVQESRTRKAGDAKTHRSHPFVFFERVVPLMRRW